MTRKPVNIAIALQKRPGVQFQSPLVVRGPQMDMNVIPITISAGMRRMPALVVIVPRRLLLRLQKLLRLRKQ